MNSGVISMARWFMVTAVCMSATTLLAQKGELRTIDRKLTSAYKTFERNRWGVRTDSADLRFKRQLIKELQNPVTFSGHLANLSEFISIKTSPDRKVKFYSWDNLDGGTWHTINCLAQFIAADGKVVVQQLNTPDETENGGYTDSGVYEVNIIVTDSLTFYLIFAAGTHGSGHEHTILRVFTLGEGKLEECFTCYPDGEYVTVVYPRLDNVRFAFDASTYTITYPEYILGYEMDGFFAASGKELTLKFIAGTFVKQ